MKTPEIVIIGAGFAGSVVAERTAAAGKRVLLIEKKSHVGGHCHDQKDALGILTQTYGPHIFHTNNTEVWKYLSKFTEWLPYEHKVLTWIGDKRVPLPFNLNTIDQLFPPEKAAAYQKTLLSHFSEGEKIPILQLRKRAEEMGEPLLKELADYIYEKAFLHYTRKQWGLEPEELVGVLERVPVLLSRDDRYFHDTYQAMPKEGYTAIFERLLDNPNIELLLRTSYQDVLTIDLEAGTVQLFGKPWNGVIVYTGALDEFFKQKYGQLPYRSLRFERKEVAQEHVQAVPVENHPNHQKFTRITEYKLFYKRESTIPKTALYYEYPEAYTGENDPYYPIPQVENHTRRDKYLAERENLLQQDAVKFYFVGRLAEYKYYNMDRVVENSLSLSKEILKAK